MNAAFEESGECDENDADTDLLYMGGSTRALLFSIQNQQELFQRYDSMDSILVDTSTRSVSTTRSCNDHSNSRMHMWDPEVRHSSERHSSIVEATKIGVTPSFTIPRYWRSSVMTISVAGGGLGNFSLTCVVINLISTGYILLPQGKLQEQLDVLHSHVFAAFAKTGTLLSCLVLGIVSFQAFVAGNFVLIAGSYAEAQENRDFRGRLPRQYSMALRDRKYEVSNLYRRFLTYSEASFFTLTTMGDLYGITLTLCVIFAHTLAEQMPFGSYRTYICIFIGIGVPLSCTPVIDQVGVQVSFLLLRMLMVVAMIVTIFFAIGSNHFGTLEGPVNDVPLFDFSGLIQLTMTSILTTSYQFSIPCMVGASEDKKGARWIFGQATLFVYISNLIVSLSISIYFGRNGTLGASNLHWVTYHGGTNEGDHPWWVHALSSYVSLFAAIDGIAVFPLVAIALADILMSTVYGEKVYQMEENWKIRLVFRLAASLPQAVIAMFASDLKMIATYAGVCTLLSYTTAPAYLFLRSRRQARAENIPLKTHYSSALSSPTAAYGLIGLSVVILVGVVVDSLVNKGQT